MKTVRIDHSFIERVPLLGRRGVGIEPFYLASSKWPMHVRIYRQA